MSRKISRNISRRQVSAALLGVPALAQTPPVSNAKPQTVSKPGTDEDLRAQASRQVRSTAEQLRKFPIPIETEPAFRFKA